MNKNKHNYYSNNQSNRVLNIKSSIPGGKTILRKQNTDQTRYRTRGKNKCGKILLLESKGIKRKEIMRNEDVPAKPRKDGKA